MSDRDPTSREGRPRWGWVLASVAVHVAIGIALAWLEPPPAPIARRDLVQIELVDLPAGSGGPAGGSTSNPRSNVPSEPVTAPAEPADPTPTDPPTPSPAQPASPSSAGSESIPPTPSVPTVEPSAPPEFTASDADDTGSSLALSNLRHGSKVAPGSVPRPSVGLGHFGTSMPERSSTPAPGPARPPPPPAPDPGESTDDSEPRSFAEAGFKPRKDGTMVYRAKGFKYRAVVHPDGRLTFQDLPGIPGSMPGLNEAIQSAAGEELYRKEKKRLLERTRALRMQLAIQFAQHQIDVQLKALNRQLARIWKDASRPAIQRRRLLFERWDECDEPPKVEVASVRELGKDAASKIDEVRLSAARQARKRIEAFIRKHLPKSGPDAYTPEELETLNRDRVSEARFEPYG